MPETLPPAADSQQPPPVDPNLAQTQQQPPVAGGQPPEQVDPPARTFLDDARELGFVDVKDEADFQTRLREALKQERDAAQAAQRRAQEMEELAYLRAQQHQQLLAQQQQPQQQVNAQANGSKWWNPPQVDQAAVEFYRNEDGTWKPEAPLDVKQQVQRYEDYRRQWARKMVDSPEEAFAPLVNEIVQKKLAEAQAQLQATTEEEAAKQRFLREADWAFQVDPVTKQRRRDAAGNFLVSADGAKFGEYMDLAANSGIASFAGQLQYAQALRELDLLRAQQGQQSATQQTQQTNQQLKQDLLNRGLQNQQRSGTFPKPGDPPARTQNRHLSLGERTLALMQANGHA